jgi:hypothetical protein
MQTSLTDSKPADRRAPDQGWRKVQVANRWRLVQAEHRASSQLTQILAVVFPEIAEVFGWPAAAVGSLRLLARDLRHTAASLLIAAGRSLHEVKDQLGHSSIRVTSDRYGRLFPEARAAIAEALDVTYRKAPAACSRPRSEISLGPDATQRPRTAADVQVMRERTTGFEPATPTLARLCSTS